MLRTLAVRSVARVAISIPLKRLIRAAIPEMIGRNGIAVNIADRAQLARAEQQSTEPLPTEAQPA